MQVKGVSYWILKLIGSWSPSEKGNGDAPRKRLVSELVYLARQSKEVQIHGLVQLTTWHILIIVILLTVLLFFLVFWGFTINPTDQLKNPPGKYTCRSSECSQLHILPAQDFQSCKTVGKAGLCVLQPQTRQRQRCQPNSCSPGLHQDTGCELQQDLRLCASPTAGWSTQGLF